jgi:two-component system cell cycle response regulator CpdR
LKILVAEDETEILRIYKIVLENEGHEVVTKGDGEECMRAYKEMLDKSTVIGEPAFDLLILDHRMPKKTGLEVANEVLAICPSQEILMLTAYAGQLEISDNLHKMNVLQKPFELDELISLIKKLVAKTTVY